MENNRVITLEISASDFQSEKRLDQFLAKTLENKSRSAVRQLFEDGKITLAPDNIIELKKLELKKMPPIGTRLQILIPPPAPAEAIAQNIPLDIIYEDEHLLFVNKPAGLVVHPAPGNPDGTLVNAVLYHCPDLKGIGDQLRPGIVHRLDKGTSGVMVVAKSQKCHEGLVKLFSTHDIDRRYNAIVMSPKLNPQGTISTQIGRHLNNRLKMSTNQKPGQGKKAITHFKVLEYFEKFSLVEFKLETGRTHQIRVHCSEFLKAAILCDPLYGNPKEHLNRINPVLKKAINDYPHPFLHARELGLKHPITGEYLNFKVDPPNIFQQVLTIAGDIR